MTVVNRCAVISSVLGLVFLSTARAEEPEHMVAEANALDQRFIEALNNADVGAVMDTYWNSEELVNFAPDAMVARGWNQVREGVSQMFANMPGAHFKLAEVHQMVAGDLVIGWGLWRVTMPTPEGGSTTMEGRYTDVKTRRDGKWVYILDHASAPLAPPPDASAETGGEEN